ncbi:MAG: hypothetical protein B6243_13470, partial [Anaerolineaceae bacterium 4572_5.2]
MKKTAALTLPLTLAIIALFSLLLPVYSRADDPQRALQSSVYNILYSAYLGGAGSDTINAVAADSAGNIYVTGQTLSGGFASDSTVLAATQVFVAKIKRSNGAVDYVKIFGGSQNDQGTAIAVDTAGYLYVTGNTQSPDFGATPNVAQPQLGRFNDAFVVKLNAVTGDIVYATYLGGYQDDFGAGIAVDSAGNAYVTGVTYSSDFPDANNSLQGIGDAFVTKLNSSGSDILYSTYLGGSGEDGANAIGVDANGNAYLTGITYSTDFPTSTIRLTKTLPSTNIGFDTADTFVSKLNNNGNALLYSTFLGGNNLDEGTAIFVANANTVYLTGITYSDDLPVSANAFQSQPDGLRDAFVAKLNIAVSTLAYATYLGGSHDDYGTEIIVDNEGFAYVSGSTISHDFPVSIGAFASAISGSTDAFLAKFNPAASGAYVTCLGGNKADQASGIVLSANNPYLVGSAQSTNFPTSANAPYPSPIGGGQDAFVTGFAPITPTTSLADTYIQTSGYHYPAPGQSLGITLRYGNYGQIKSAAILTAALDSRLQYLGDNSGLPVTVSGSVIRWQLPEM